MNCGFIDKDDSDLRCNEHCLSNSEDKAWTKDLGSLRNWVHEPYDTGAVL